MRGIMAVQVVKMPSEHGHLFGDIPALALVAILLAALTPRGAAVPEARNCFLIVGVDLRASGHPLLLAGLAGFLSVAVKLSLSPTCGRGGTGRRTSLRGWR